MKKYFPLQMWSFFLILFFISCETDMDEPLDFQVIEIPENTDPSKLIDFRDNKTYKVVKIGKQFWMAENLNFRRFNGSECYNRSDRNCEVFGRLYDWETAVNSCPRGWHLPSIEEWTTMIDHLGGETEAYKKIISISSWQHNDLSITNKTEFSGLPGGYGVHSSNFREIGESAYWWTSTAPNVTQGKSISFQKNQNRLNNVNFSKSYLLNCRCVKD